MTVVLLADCVSKAFRGRRILGSASLRATAGEMRILLGRNGEGKSTLLKIAAGLIEPDSGSVHFDGIALEVAKLHTLALAGLFYLPDQDLLSDAFTVRTQLEMIRRRYDGGDVEASARTMGILERLDQRPGALSGGERRRAELAVVLVRNPRCLLADEPFRGIAPKDAEDIVRVLRGVAASGAAVVVTGHEVPTLMAAADHVTWCTAGTTYELGSPNDAVGNERFRREYLGSRS